MATIDVIFDGEAEHTAWNLMADDRYALAENIDAYPDGYFLVIACSRKSIVGYAIVYAVDHDDTAVVAIIETRVHGKGVGRMMLDYLQQHYECVLLHDVANDRNYCLFKRYGFDLLPMPLVPDSKELRIMGNAHACGQSIARLCLHLVESRLGWFLERDADVTDEEQSREGENSEQREQE